MGQSSTSWIARRVLQAKWPDGRVVAITVEIGIPYASDADGDFWYTPYRITGIEPPEVTEIFGVDAVASLAYAIVTVGLRLSALSERGVELSWLGGDPGFPVLVFPPGAPP